MFIPHPLESITGLAGSGIGKRARPLRRTSPHPPGNPPAASAAGEPSNNPASPADPPTPVPDDPDRGFPANTPWRDMKPDERVNYWKFHDRQKSNKLDAYEGITPELAKQYRDAADDARRNQMQPSERALEDARSEAAATARTAADQSWAAQMTEIVVGQFVTDPAQQQVVLAGLNPAQFLNEGKFDKDKLIGHMTGLAAAFGGGPARPPANGNQPSQWGQGGSLPPAKSGRDEGLAEAKRRGYIKD